MSYQPMPSTPPPGPPVERGPAPASVRNAVLLMLTRAALGVIGIIVLFATKNSLEKTIRDKNLGKSTTDINNLVDTAVTVGAVIAVVFIVLYVLLALQVRKGKNWARIVTWVFAGLGVLGFLTSFAQDQTGATRVLGVLDGLIDIVVIVSLALTPSNEYFRKPAAQGYGAAGQWGPPPGGYPPPGYGPPPGQQSQYGPPPGQQGQYGPPPGQQGQYGPPPGQQGQYGPPPPGQYGPPQS